MATMTLPICDLGAVIDEAEKAEADTKRVVSVSGAAVATVGLTFEIFRKTISVRKRLSHLVANQADMLTHFTACDFSSGTAEALASFAGKIDDLVAHERGLLADAESLGVPIRVWWESSLSKLADQVEHLDSISESLHLAADAETSGLLAMALSELAMAT